MIVVIIIACLCIAWIITGIEEGNRNFNKIMDAHNKKYPDESWKGNTDV